MLFGLNIEPETIAPVPKNSSKLFSDAGGGAEVIKVGLGRSFLGSTLVTAVANVLVGAIALLASIPIQKLLHPSDYGLLGMVVFFVGLANILKDGGLSAATVQRKNFLEIHASTLFWVNVGLGLVAATTIAISGPLFAWIYSEPRLKPIAPLLAIPIFISSLSQQHLAILRRNLHFRSIAIIRVASAIISAGVAFGVAYVFRNYIAIIAMQITSGLLTLVGAWVAAKWMPKFRVNFSETLGFLGFGKNVTFFSIMVYFTRNLDNFLIGRQFGTIELGQYTRAYAYLLNPLSQVTSPVNGVLNSYLPKLLDEPAKFRRIYVKCIETVLLAACPIGIVAVSTADLLVEAVFGNAWLTSGQVIRVLGICLFAQPLTSLLGALFLSQDRSREMVRCGVWTSLVTVASFFLGLPWGALGVAVAYTSAFFLLQLPLAIYFSGGRGIVRSNELVSIIVSHLGYVFCALAITLSYRYWIFDQQESLLISLLVICVVSPIACAFVFTRKRALIIELVCLAKNFVFTRSS
ncbi:Teichuronic acid biosynthesis protein TuaB [Mariniblastus fucicola]|uniref:Teichuronic acid biosynthesis protein TuaB n=2 Tax=Mariniblastus fucicola TaxID=980251 RepID=A0A5B9PAZ1_9BACT|nr:Teichuronic acid biosynthesis protein TuaB [Mariniblastus fucicola]